jgi:hypothetical protein
MQCLIKKKLILYKKMFEHKKNSLNSIQLLRLTDIFEFIFEIF